MTKTEPTKRTYESFEWELVSPYIATRAAYFLTSADWRFQRCLEADEMHSAVCQARRNAKVIKMIKLEHVGETSGKCTSCGYTYDDLNMIDEHSADGETTYQHEVCEVCTQDLYDEHPQDTTVSDDEWRREQAMEAGMLHGIDAYNEVMGY